VPVPGHGARHGAVRRHVGAILQQPAVPVRAWGRRRAAQSVSAMDGEPAVRDRVLGPAGVAGRGGFVDADTLASQVLPVVEGAANFGGDMLWSRSYDKGSGFSVKLQGILQDQNNQGTDCTVRSADENVTDCESVNYIRTFH
jgi:hypothetical protein